MNNLIKKFKILVKNKKSLHIEFGDDDYFRTYSMWHRCRAFLKDLPNITVEKYAAVDKHKLCELVLVLDKLGYGFTSGDYKNLICNIAYGKSNSVMAKAKGDLIWNDKSTMASTIVAIIFKNYTPTPQELKLLFSCKLGDCLSPILVNILSYNQYPFSSDQIVEIARGNCKIDTILSYTTLTLEQINEIMKHGMMVEKAKTIVDYFKSQNLVPNEESIISLLSNGAMNGLWTELVETFLAMGFSNKPVTKRCFDIIVKEEISNENVINMIIGKIDNLGTDTLLHFCKKGDDKMIKMLLTTGVEPNLACLNKYLKENEFLRIGGSVAGDYDVKKDLEIFDIFVEKGAEPDVSTLRVVCGLTNIFLLDLISDRFGIYPDKSCLDYALSFNKDYNIDIIKRILDYKILPNAQSFDSLMKSFAGFDRYIMETSEKLELLIYYGLKMDFDMVKRALYNGIYTNNLEMFGIEYGEQLYYTCHLYNRLPDEYIKKFTIDKNIIELRNMFKRRLSLKTYVDFMKKHNIKPDRYCFENACHYNQRVIDRIFIEMECEPTIACPTFLQYSSSVYYGDYPESTEMLLQLYEKYKIDQHYMAKPYDCVDIDILKGYI